MREREGYRPEQSTAPRALLPERNPIPMKKTPTQRVREWAAETLGDESDTSPRCEKYPACGGETGLDHVQFDPHEHPLKTTATLRAGAKAPCKQCLRYVRAMRLIEQLEGKAKT